MPNEAPVSPRGCAILIQALTPLHPGSGTNPGVIDLPIQRERHTRWPNIPASALKGVFRDYSRQKVAQGRSAKEADADEQIVNVFGRSLKGDGEEKGGALSFTDARILAFPVRSLFGVYALVTCPSALHRFSRDLTLTGMNASDGQTPTVKDDDVLVTSDSVLKGTKSSVVLEEFPFTADSSVDGLFVALAASLGISTETQKRLAIISDDQFTHFVENATEVQMRIALDYETKTVQDGALFSQEFLPTETLLYSLVLASASRNQNGHGSAALASFQNWFGQKQGSILQIGGDETVGKGFCRVTVHEDGKKGQV